MTPSRQARKTPLVANRDRIARHRASGSQSGGGWVELLAVLELDEPEHVQELAAGRLEEEGTEVVVHGATAGQGQWITRGRVSDLPHEQRPRSVTDRGRAETSDVLPAPVGAAAEDEREERSGRDQDPLEGVHDPSLPRGAHARHRR